MDEQATVPVDEKESELVARLTEARSALLAEVHKVIVGQDEVLEQLLLADRKSVV
jgi:hypothetical protein